MHAGAGSFGPVPWWFASCHCRSLCGLAFTANMSAVPTHCGKKSTQYNFSSVVAYIYSVCIEYRECKSWRQWVHASCALPSCVLSHYLVSEVCRCIHWCSSGVRPVSGSTLHAAETFVATFVELAEHSPPHHNEIFSLCRIFSEVHDNILLHRRVPKQCGLAANHAVLWKPIFIWHEHFRLFRIRFTHVQFAYFCNPPLLSVWERLPFASCNLLTLGKCCWTSGTPAELDAKESSDRTAILATARHTMAVYETRQNTSVLSILFSKYHYCTKLDIPDMMWNPIA